MEFIPVEDTLRVSVVGEQSGQIVVNTYHVRATTPWTPIEALGVGGIFAGWLATELAPLQTSELTWEKIVLRDLTEQNGLSVEYTATFPIPGGYSGDPALPNNVTVAVKWGTGYSGRSYRGRTYHLGMTSDQVVDNNITTAARAALKDAYQALIDVITLGGYELVVCSLYTDKLPRSLGLTTPINEVSVNPVVDSQRRRLPTRGK